MEDAKIVVITGGAGFIGSHLVELFLHKNYKVIVIDDLSSGNISNLPQSKNLYFFKKDIRDPSIECIYKRYKPNIIFHLAAHFANELSIQEPIDDLDVNGGGTLAQLELAKKIGVERFVYASTSCVYNPSEYPLKEDGSLCPHTPYGISKLSGEYYCQFYKKYYGLPITILRYFNCYGSKENTNFYRGVVPKFIHQALRGLPIIITGSGDEKRDFTYIEDTVKATYLAAIKEEGKNEIFNIGTGQSTSIFDLAQNILKISKRSLDIQYNPRRLWDETFYRTANIKKLYDLLDFQPQYSLEKGLSKTWNWYDEISSVK
ncbi:NAD-dependent epimerase/dehydratase family protein [Inediibacterium massiliense]|uniref:NAD-dependent epimerase/dehydratase family protein n=1 Tax=Inediibacterium massiliense TaxID=1658111 RepID=UPI0006B5717C|nr:NAD-dependent epimerase/dehydratase family protein [Inediibacterium massiliense]